jgi:hypothetical protein
MLIWHSPESLTEPARAATLRINHAGSGETQGQIAQDDRLYGQDAAAQRKTTRIFLLKEKE